MASVFLCEMIGYLLMFLSLGMMGHLHKHIFLFPFSLLYVVIFVVSNSLYIFQILFFLWTLHVLLVILNINQGSL